MYLFLIQGKRAFLGMIPPNPDHTREDIWILYFKNLYRKKNISEIKVQ